MSQEARFVPIINYGVELPPYIEDVERIVVDTRRVSQAALLGCFQESVDIADYTGSTTQYQQEILGMGKHGDAIAGRKTGGQEAQLGSFAFDKPVLSNAKQPAMSDMEPALQHDHPALTVKLNMAEVQQRLQEAHARQRDPNVWAKQFNLGMKQGLRAASWEHLTVGFAPPGEVVTSLTMLAVLSIADNAAHEFAHLSFDSPTAAEQVLSAIEVIQNAAKLMVALKQRADLRSTCFSLLPGYHLDCYGLVKLATMRRMICVMDVASTSEPGHLPTAA